MAWICSYGVVDCPECRRSGATLKADAIPGIDRLYFRIPYADKEQAKALGARWDADRRLWYGLGSNPKLSEIGKRWPVATPPKPKPSWKPPVPDLFDRAQAPVFDVTATTTQVGATAPEPEDPPPGLFSFDELMDAIRAADAQASDSSPVAREKVSVEKKNAR